MANKSKNIVPPYYPMRNHYLVAPEYRLATCEIEKNMLTIRHGIFCYLTNTAEFRSQKRSISTEFWGDWLCKESSLHNNNISGIVDTIGANLTLFTVVRHPIDRFLSGYVDKCKKELTYFTEEERCFRCRDDMRCFVDILHEVFMNHSSGHTKTTGDSVADRMNRYYIRHFAPQTWYCEFKDHKNDYIIVDYHYGLNRTRQVADDFVKIFQQANVPRHHLRTIYSEMMKGTTRHSTAKSSSRTAAQQQLLLDEYVMRRLMQMYFYDFVEFGFS